MTQFELLVLPCVLSITVALAWALISVKGGSSEASISFMITSFAAAVISILLFIASLFYIIENLGVEAPGKVWESPFLWGWIILSISFFLTYAGHLLARGNAAR